jgi:hypothetical protein
MKQALHLLVCSSVCRLLQQLEKMSSVVKGFVFNVSAIPRSTHFAVHFQNFMQTKIQGKRHANVRRTSNDYHDHVIDEKLLVLMYAILGQQLTGHNVFKNAVHGKRRQACKWPSVATHADRFSHDCALGRQYFQKK